MGRPVVMRSDAKLLCTNNKVRHNPLDTHNNLRISCASARLCCTNKIEDGSTHLTLRDLAVEIARHPPLAEQLETAHFDFHP